ncbi:hypothetical protein HK098_002984 [Nowakowskiella sp. JEL0407]|nr:hypothetical protein HK098_002984 [Nowakowskiella sp. JEL0407]
MTSVTNNINRSPALHPYIPVDDIRPEDLNGSTFDPAHDVLHYDRQILDSIFAPKCIAVIGATETAGSVGRTIFWNLISSPFGGVVYPVNPKRPSVLGVKAFSSLSQIPESQIDLIVVAVPAKAVPKVIREAVSLGVKGAIIISAGFKEIGPAGVELERQVLEIAKSGDMRIIGPNCLGVMNPVSGINATFASTMAKRGHVGFISQSGALCTAVLDWSLRENVGFSAFVSLGSMLDVGWGDLIYYLGDDPNTSCIIIYMETIGDARGFLSAAREVALSKPIIVIKPGRSAAAAKAAASHTGSLTGSDDVLEVAFQRSGVLRVNTIAELFYMAEVLDKQPLPKGRNLTFVTNAGGPGVIATDAQIMNGGQLTTLSEETHKKLDAILPDAWSHNNPIDILGDASPERYAKTLEIAAQDPNSDGLLVILTPQSMTDPTATAEMLKPYAEKQLGKPILASWMGGSEVAAGKAILSSANIPTFDYPDTAALMFNYMAQYSENLQQLYQIPNLHDDHQLAANGAKKEQSPAQKAEELIQAVRKSGRDLLTEYESKKLLSFYGIVTVDTRIATSAEAAVKEADAIGYPVVLKIHSETITHKTDVGGVKLNLTDAKAVQDAYNSIKDSVTEKAGAEHFLGVTVQPFAKMPEGSYELILGSSLDPQFGPVLLFGLGGSLVEVFKDRSLGLPPLTTSLARHMMQKTKIYKALKGVRGHATCDLPSIENLMVRFSHLVAEQSWIKEIDINPLVVSPSKPDPKDPSKLVGLVLALDARVVLHGTNVKEGQLPKLSIRPYPTQYVTEKRWKTSKGKEIAAIIRPIKPEDEPALVEFHKTLSQETVTLRYLHPRSLDARISHDRLARICHADYDREVTLVVWATETGENNQVKESKTIMAASRMSKLHGSDDAVFSCMVADHYQGSGVGTALIECCVNLAKSEGWGTLLVPEIKHSNVAMKKILERLGFTLKTLPSKEGNDEYAYRAEILLN